MSPETALRILGLAGKPSASAIETARRQLLAALHPDKHPTGPKDVFERMVVDVREAYDVLTAQASQAQLRDDAGVENALFHASASAQWNDALLARGKALARFDRSYAKDKIVALAVLGLDPRFSWYTTNRFTGGSTDKVGTALYLLVWNRTKRRVESLYVSNGLLIDDTGHQYSSEGSFCWSEGDGSFHTHSDTLVPNAKLDGFVLYPSLRAGATAFARWYLAGSIKIGDQWIDVEYDIALPRAAQEQARLAATPSQDDEDLAGEDDDTDASDSLDDKWLYGDE